MLYVKHHAYCVIMVVIMESKQYSYSYVIEPSLHRSVHSFCMVCVVVLWSFWMHVFIGVPVVGLLEKDVGSDSCFFQLSVIFYAGSGDVDVYSPDLSVVMLYGIYGLYALKQVLERAVYRVLSQLQRKTLVAHVLKGYDFFFYFLLS